MSFIKRYFKRAEEKDKVLVLSLDGVGLDFLTRCAESGLMPHTAQILSQGSAIALDSVLPTVSTVAWANYFTGVNPGAHGVYGFVDRRPDPFTVVIPTASELAVPTLWETLGRAGKKVGVVNVPLTFPPQPVNGFMVSGFLSPDLASATYPVELAPRLMELDYRIDADTGLARNDMGGFLSDLGQTLARRFSAGFSLMNSEPWDFFQLHIMATDRINHFLWGAEDGSGEEAEWGSEFRAFYRKLDSYLGELAEELPTDARLVLVSDHGFAFARGHLFVNHWLEQNGYLLFSRGKREFRNMHPESKAYSLAPGRIYINLAGREEKGSVEPGQAYEDLRRELISRLGTLRDPQSGEPLLYAVHCREDIYAGGALDRAADLILEPARGIEIKPRLDAGGILSGPDLPGAHNFDGAFLFISGVEAKAGAPNPSLLDVAPTILDLMDIEAPHHLEGSSLL